MIIVCPTGTEPAVVFEQNLLQIFSRILESFRDSLDGYFSFFKGNLRF